MYRRLFVLAVLVATSLLVPATAAGAGSALPALHVTGVLRAAPAKPAALPTIKRVSPLKLKIGAKLTIFGRNFVPGKHRDTVVFLRDGAPAIFLKVDTATKRRLTLKLPSKLAHFLVLTNTGVQGPTKFRLRVLARRFGASFTSKHLSPTILPRSNGDGGDGEGPVCSLASAKLAPLADADNDGLTNALEARIKTDPCSADTDGDGVTDGYEYESALDLNSRALPYPGKRPYPNALDPTDAGVDYDGDGLTLTDEFTAWVRYGGSKFPLNYSDGTQTSGGPVPVTPQTAWADMNSDGVLSDDEKDIDHDGLTNWDEAHGRMQPDWWTKIVSTEKPFTVGFRPTDWLDPDTDGDGLVDGPDDVDHDGYTNAEEVNRGPYWVQPFNPCLPDPHSRTCPLHPPPPDTAYPPFGPPGYSPGESIPLIWPRP